MVASAGIGVGNTIWMCFTMVQIQWACSAALFMTLLLAQPLYAAEPKETKSVLVLYSEDKAHPGHELTDQGIRATFRSDKRFDVHVYSEYLDLSRFGSPARKRSLSNYLGAKYAAVKIDVIIAVYPSALQVLLGEVRQKFPGTPIVFCEVDRNNAERLKDSPLRHILTGVVMGDTSAEVFVAALRMRPHTKRVALISGTAPNDAYGEQIARRDFQPYARQLELIDLTKLPMDEVLTRVGSLPPETIVFYSSVFKDGAGKDFVPREALSLISQAANAPVFGFFDSLLGYGIVGGRLVSFRQQGEEAADLALRIIAGESPGSIPFTGEQAYVNLYDWRQLKRWKIPETTVPPGSEIRYRNPSLWEEHAWSITSLTVLFIVQSLLIFGLVTNLRRRRKTERSLLESEERVRLAVSSAGAGLWTLDTVTGAVWATYKTREILGVAADEDLDSEKFIALIHPEDRERVQRAMQEALQTEQEVRVEYRIVLPDGSDRWIISRGRRRQEGDGRAKVLTGASIDITHRKHIEEKLWESERDLSMLAGRLISAQEEERSRVARELHDDFTQRLAVLAIDAGGLELESESAHVHEKLGTIKKGLVKISQDIHDLSRQLHPAILGDLGIVKAIQSECVRLSRNEGFDASFTYEKIPDKISQEVSLALYRIFQAGLRNSVLHSQAKTAHIVLKGSDGTIELSIADTGIGFDLLVIRDKPGLGIASMRERSKLVHGEFSIDSAPGEGTLITVTVPLDEREP